MILNKFVFLFLLSISAWAGNTISISMVGDIMMATSSSFQSLSEAERVSLFDPAKEWIQSSHIRFANFEGTFFDGGTQFDGKVNGPNRFLFKTPTAMAPLLKDAGFNVLSLANNHIRDFGTAGEQSTKQTLRQIGIQYSSKAGEVAEFQVGQTRISLIATDYYKAPRSITETVDTIAEIRDLKSRGHLVIVSSHAGGEGSGAEFTPLTTEIYLGENRGDVTRFAREAIDAGADLIVMHGPHVPRGMNIYRDRLIIYSLGNFMTGKGISLEGNAKVAPLVRVELSHRGDFVSGQIVPFIQKRGPQRIELDLEKTAIILMKKLTETQFPRSGPKILADGSFAK